MVELSRLEAWAVGPVWEGVQMGVKMGVQSPAAWVLAVEAISCVPSGCALYALCEVWKVCGERVAG